MAELNPNIVTGLGSGMDTKSVIDKLVQAERKKIEPVIQRKEEKTLQLDAWKQVKSLLDGVQASADSLSKKSLWEGKIVESSHPEVVEATATSGAKPGKHTLVVDKLALNHQIASQGFESKDSQIGKGRVRLTVGEGDPLIITVDDTNNTVQGFADAINAQDGDVGANVIKTGAKEKPFQIVLTSKKTGREGQIVVVPELDESEFEAPTFDPYYSQPSKWKGLDRPDDKEKKPTGTGASTAFPELIGEYQGEEALDLTFTVVNTGIVGVSESLKMRWEDNQGRFGYIDLGSFNYTPGEPVEVVDGIQLIMSDGEVIVNDTFKAGAKNAESELYWWKSAEERQAGLIQPSSWGRQATEGGPVITGKYESEDDDVFKLTVVGSGAIGQAEDLKIVYESEQGLKGTLFVGAGYEPGTKLSMGKGLELSLKPGLLNEGDTSSFEFQAESTADYWWLSDGERHEGGSINNLTQWISTPKEDEEEEGAVSKAGPSPGKPAGPRVSSASKEIVGKYNDFESKVYTFTALSSGSVGVTKGLELKWEDNKGNTGVLKVGGEDYQLGNPMAFDSGLSLVMGEGNIFEGDSFTFRTFSPVIQPPQDAEVRLGATDLGGGLLITNPTNTLDDVIDGVKLDLISTSEKPVTISIKGDTEKALAGVKSFVETYNQMLTYFVEVTAYNKDTKEAGPLQGDRNLPRIQAETNRIFIDTVRGLPQDANQLLSIGLKISDKGMIELDEDKLTAAINDDLGKVANLFRSYGTSDNSAIVYLNSTEKTAISGDKGWEVDVTSAATTGFYTTRQLQTPITIDEDNKDIYLNINGRESEVISLEPGMYDPDSLAKHLQKKVAEDKNIGKMKVVVSQDQGMITIRSNVTGSKSTVDLRPLRISGTSQHPLAGGVNKSGQDVTGRVNGIEMQGNGQILAGPEGTDLEGLKLYVSLTESQVGEGAETQLVFTKGVGTKVLEYIQEVTDAEKGALSSYTKNVETQLKDFDKEVKTLESRIESKQEKLVEKFARMESKLGQLKSEQNYLTKELAKL